jgi:electron transport complex protein RnfB
MVAIVFDDRCTGCGACLLTCPTHAIRPAGGGLVALAERCTGCGECVEVCPADAVDLLSGEASA